MNQVQRFLCKLFAQIGSPRARQLHQLVSEGRLREAQLLSMPGPSAYRTPLDYRRDRLATDIIKKLRLPGDDVLRERNSVLKFVENERACALTNHRFRRYQRMLAGDILIPEEDRLWVEVLVQWRVELKRLLGRIPLHLVPRFSGGSTLSDSGKLTTIPDKMSSRTTIYESCVDVWRNSIKFTPFGEKAEADLVVRANRFFTVPKNSEINRMCCMEASGALSLQLAVGEYLKARYKLCTGHNLREAKPIHMDLARQASITGHLATIDLSSASDMISRELVKAVLPTDWWLLLNSLRATHTEVWGAVVYNEKFSSMGNGFTFELETILFRTLMKVITNYDVRVFGDDIIIDSSSAPLALKVLEWAGFRINEKKSFCEGPFRESCGGDYFEGVSVRGHFLEEIPDAPQNWVALANGLHRVGLGRTAAWFFCVDQVPSDWRVFGPSFLGDTCFNDDEAEPIYKPGCSPGQLSPYWTVKVPVSRKFKLGEHFPYRIATAAASLGVKSNFSTRKDVIGYRTRRVLAWGTNLPDWLSEHVKV